MSPVSVAMAAGLPCARCEITFCGPAVAVAGFTRIGSRVFLGICTVVIDNVTVHEGARTAGGAVVTTDIPPGLCVGGVPAKPLGDKG